MPFPIACGTCFTCERGLTSQCESSNPSSSLATGVFGYSHTTGGYDGGQAEYVRVPFADVGPMTIPDDMSDEDVLFLSDILPTGYQGAEMGDIREGETVVVFGAGPVGAFTARCAWLLGAGRVIVVDRLDYRLDFVRGFGPAETVNCRDVGDVVLHLKRMTDGRGPDVCIDAVGCEASGSAMHGVLGKVLKLESGNPIAISWCIDAVRKGGRVSIIGVYGPPWNVVPIGTAMNKGLTSRTNQCNVHRYMPHLLEHIRSGVIDAKAIISHRLPVFGTAQPPRGVSGVMRRLAYRIPEHHAKHWMLLLAADRVDVVGHRLIGAAKWLPLALPAAAALGFTTARRRRSRLQRAARFLYRLAA